MSPTNLEQSEWPLGTHLVTPRFGYHHHGIYIGSSKVLHYAGLCEGWRIGPVEKVSLAAFACGREVWVKQHPKAKYSGRQVVARALSRMGERRYSLFRNNCEHLCTWSVDGISYSEQVATLLMRPMALMDFLGDLLQKLPRNLGSSHHQHAQ